MTETVVGISALRSLAQQHAREIVEAEARDGTGGDVHAGLLLDFQKSRQPVLSDKHYTALYRTYCNMISTAISNHYSPGSAVEPPPVQVSSIRDGDEVYRAASTPMTRNEWEQYAAELTAMAERFAFEVAELASNGGDAEGRMEEQQYEVAQFSLDHGLPDDEAERESVIYKDAYLKALEREANQRNPR